MNDRNQRGTVCTDSISSDWLQSICNPRNKRTLDGLANGRPTAKELNEIIGTVNAHPYLHKLRVMGCEIRQEQVKGTDRDGNTCRFNRYWLSDNARRQYLTHRSKGGK